MCEATYVAKDDTEYIYGFPYYNIDIRVEAPQKVSNTALF